MSAVVITGLIVCVFSLIVLTAASFHSARKSGESLSEDKLPPNSYPASYFGTTQVEDDPLLYDVESPDEISEEEEEEINPRDSE